mmetsp:Transcript_31270/g.57228  ORF Transcript_31270/g.57228 Transcript_31270/m.57228 type:complete len:597 (+) Transcript_31270:81-1871(+)
MADSKHGDDVHTAQRPSKTDRPSADRGSPGLVANPETVVTSIINLKSKKGDDSMDAFFEEIYMLLSTFEGFLKRDILTYEQPDGSLTHTVILTFENYKTLRAWLLSIEREDIIRKYEPTIDEAKIAAGDEVVEIDGVMSKPRKPAKARPPPKWKLYLITELAAWLIVWAMTDSGLIRFMSKQVRESFATTTFLTMCLLVPALVYAITPVLTHLLRPWLTQPRPHYKKEPFKTLDAGCGLFIPPSPLVEPEEVEELRDRLNRMEAVVRKMAIKEMGLTAGAEPEVKRVDGPHSVDGSDVISVISPTPTPQTAQPPDLVSMRQISKPSTASYVTRTMSTKLRKHDPFAASAQQLLELDLEKALPVTGVAHHHVKWECERDFLELCNQFRSTQQKKFPGFLGMTTLHGRRDGLGYSQEFVNIWRYRTYDEMSVQATSQERADFLNSIKHMLESPSAIQFAQERHILDSMTEIFVNPGEDAKAVPPPLWKTSLCAILGLMMCAWPVNENFGPVLEDWGVEETWLRVLILTSINVALNSWACVPFVILLLGGWLHRQREHGFSMFTEFLDRGFPYLWMKVAASVCYSAALVVLVITKPFPD